MKILILGLVLVSSPAFADTNIWKDITRHHRDDVTLNADAGSCSAQFGPDLNNAPTSQPYKRCMRSHGWVLQRVIKEPDESWIDPDTGDTCHDLKLNGTVIGSSCGNF